jgi:hypothetical protein
VDLLILMSWMIVELATPLHGPRFNILVLIMSMHLCFFVGLTDYQPSKAIVQLQLRDYSVMLLLIKAPFEVPCCHGSKVQTTHTFPVATGP